MRVPMRPWKRLLLAAVPAVILIAAVGAAFFAAQRALNRSARSLLTAHQVAFTFKAVDLGTAAAQSAAFEPVAASSGFTCGALLDQDAYLAGPAGLSVFGPDRTLRYSLRSGAELPVETITAIVTARLRGAGEQEVLLATAGAGLLALQPKPAGLPVVRQVLPTPLAERDLTALLPLASGDLLLGTRHAGVLLYNGSTLVPFRFNPPPETGVSNPATLEVTALAAPDAASVLIGTRDSGLFYVHGGTVSHADTFTGLPDRQIETLLVSERTAYAGTPLGVAEFDLAAASFRPARVLAAGVFSHALAIDTATGQLSVGTLDQGIRQVTLAAASYLRHASIVAPRDEAGPTSAQRVDAFLPQTSASAPRFALADGALIERSGSTWSAVQTSASATVAALADRDISALAFAPDGSLYVGFFDHGLDILSPNDHDNVRHLEDDHLFCINRLALDPERQTIAAATANGLVLFDRQGTARQALTRRDGLISDHISDIVFTHTGLVLATPAGITFLGAAGAESLYALQGLVNNHVYALGSAPGSSQLLAGTLGGLSVLEQGSVRRNFTAANSGLKHHWITAILPQPAGGYLIGTYGAGIQQLAPDGSFLAIDLPTGTPGNLIVNPNAMLATHNHIYAGTLDHGLLVFSAASGRWSNVTHGLPSRNITAFAERDGELYIGTDNGLVRIAESKLEAQLQ